MGAFPPGARALSRRRHAPRHRRYAFVYLDIRDPWTPADRAADRAAAAERRAILPALPRFPPLARRRLPLRWTDRRFAL
jgi:hypothetical protein